ncbi:hypothetical protein P3T37_004342 [Kitasatospora sp. MAA4]|uniref:hypothetical protein n=1 Tax=Kitasatospora sp. MAA4 TaxID=3035093 RepID=UPI002472FC52|nr:hypothetical protein [Kitasatospora sp. MAA4]MDH6134933.1 hypothetical protein [Kitasatospora sp. MAA4]
MSDQHSYGVHTNALGYIHPSQLRGDGRAAEFHQALNAGLSAPITPDPSALLYAPISGRMAPAIQPSRFRPTVDRVGDFLNSLRNDR